MRLLDLRLNAPSPGGTFESMVNQMKLVPPIGVKSVEEMAQIDRGIVRGRVEGPAAYTPVVGHHSPRASGVASIQGGELRIARS